MTTDYKDSSQVITPVHSGDLSKVDESFLSKDNFEHYYRMANMMSKSDMVPKGFKDKPQDILIAMEMGRGLNLNPLSAIQNIAVINGKPCLYGDGILAVCSGHPDFENIEETVIKDKDNNTIGYSCSVKRRGRSVVTQTFTVQQAKEASLWGKVGPWKQYPERMLQMRARGFALRDSFADALGGVRFAEEVRDYAEPRNITPSNLLSELNNVVNKNKGRVDNVVDEKPTKLTMEVDPETGEILPDDLQS